jgi:hypothetical protein
MYFLDAVGPGGQQCGGWAKVGQSRLGGLTPLIPLYMYIYMYGLGCCNVSGWAV